MNPRFLRQNLLAAAAVAALGVSGVAMSQTKLETEKDKVSYMVGMDMAQGLRPIKDQVDMAIVMQALQTSLAEGQTLLSAEEAQAVRQEFMRKLQGAQQAKQQEVAAKNQAEGAKFLAENVKKAGVKTTPSGLQYQVIKEGTGKKPAATSQVKVHYLGTLLDGTKFDSSYDRGEPASFALNGVIPGWTEGLQLMPAGSKYKFWIPAALGYGERGTPGPIGPNATLVFEVELMEVLD